MIRVRPLALVTMMAMLAACASAPLIALPTPVAAASQTADPGEATFWASFDSPLLQALLQEVAQDNPDLLIAIERQAIAEDAVRLAQAQQRPTLGFHLGPVDTTATTLASRRSQQTAAFALGFEASYELDLRGRLARLSSAARADARASGDDIEALRIATHCLVAQGVFELAQADQMLALQRQRQALAERRLQLQVLRADAGRVTAAIVDDAQAQQLAVGEAVMHWQLQHRAALVKLAALFGQSADEFLKNFDVPAAMPQLPDVPEGLPSSLLQRRPDLQAAAARVEAADARDAAERALQFPQIRLTASLGVASDLLHRAASGAIGLFGLGPSLDLPIYDGGALAAQIDTRDHELQIARLEYRKTSIAAFADVEQALALRAAADGERRDAEQNAQRCATEQRALALEQSAGRKSGLDAIEAQMRGLDAEQALLDSRHAQLDSTLALFQALGGAWAPG